MSQRRDTEPEYTRGTLDAMRGWVLRAGLGAFLGGGAAGLLAACPSASSVFTCASDSDCTGEGNGTCQANGFCAFPDAMCQSGMRYGDLAGGGFANMCVPPDEGGSTSGIGGSGGMTSTSSPMTSTTTLTPGESSGGESSTGAAGTSDTGGSESGTTEGVTAPCELIFDDDFAGGELPPHWTFVGTGVVEVEAGAVEFWLDSNGKNSPLLLLHEDQVSFDGVWLMVNLDDMPSVNGVQAILTLNRDTVVESFGLVVDTGTQELAARRSDADGNFDRLAAVDYSLDMPWLRIREQGGRVLFEYGSDDDEMVVFHEEKADIRDWVGTLAIGADNYLFVTDEAIVSYDDASACASAR